MHPGMRRRDLLGVMLGLGAASAGSAAAHPAGGKRSADVARDRFAAALVRDRGLKPGRFSVDPPSGAEERGYHSRLKTGRLYAWSALAPDLRVLVNGLAGPGPGFDIAFEGYEAGIGRPGGLAALMEAMHVFDPRRALALDEMVLRLAFCLNRPAMGEFLFDEVVMRGSGFATPDAVRPPALRAEGRAKMLTYFTMVQGNTGTFDVWQVDVSVAPDFRTQVQRTNLGF